MQIRLRNGCYRHVAAIENDLIESFVTTAVLCIRESVSRKKSPMSMKRVGRAMASNGNSNALEDASVGAPQEENQLADHLRFVRDSHATALVATSNTEHLTRLFGLAQPVERSLQSVAVSDPEQDPDRATARQKLACLLAAVGRNNLQNAFTSKSVTSDKLPTLGATVKCNGETATHAKEVRRVDHAIAELKGKEVKVKFTCGAVVKKCTSIDLLIRGMFIAPSVLRVVMSGRSVSARSKLSLPNTKQAMTLSGFSLDVLDEWILVLAAKHADDPFWHVE